MPVTAPAPLPGQLSGNHEPLIPEGLEHEPGGRVGLWQPGDIGDQLAQRRISPVAEAIMPAIEGQRGRHRGPCLRKRHDD